LSNSWFFFFFCVWFSLSGFFCSGRDLKGMSGRSPPGFALYPARKGKKKGTVYSPRVYSPSFRSLFMFPIQTGGDSSRPILANFPTLFQRRGGTRLQDNFLYPSSPRPFFSIFAHADLRSRLFACLTRYSPRIRNTGGERDIFPPARYPIPLPQVARTMPLEEKVPTACMVI